MVEYELCYKDNGIIYICPVVLTDEEENNHIIFASLELNVSHKLMTNSNIRKYNTIHYNKKLK
jgi:hypothetical protein